MPKLNTWNCSLCMWFTSFCQVLKKMHIIENWFFFLPDGVVRSLLRTLLRPRLAVLFSRTVLSSVVYIQHMNWTDLQCAAVWTVSVEYACLELSDPVANQHEIGRDVWPLTFGVTMSKTVRGPFSSLHVLWTTSLQSSSLQSLLAIHWLMSSWWTRVQWASCCSVGIAMPGMGSCLPTIITVHT